MEIEKKVKVNLSYKKDKRLSFARINLIKEYLEVLGLNEENRNVEILYEEKVIQLKKVNDKWIEEEYKPDRNAVWRALFVEMTRSGANSSDPGIGFLLNFDGDHCIFREVSQARFKHGEIR